MHQPFLSLKQPQGLALILGITLAALTDAIASTILSFGRFAMMGDLHATADEFAPLDFGYIAAKLLFFIATPWLMGRFSAKICLRLALSVMIVACGLAAFTSQLEWMLPLRLVQGATGAMLLVGGQSLLLQAFPRTQQPLVQTIFALGGVVAPATFALSFQGWMLEILTWQDIFLSIIPIGLIALTLLLCSSFNQETYISKAKFDWLGFSLFALTVFCLTFILNRGNRWDWFETDFICYLTLIGGVALSLFLIQQYRAQGGRVLLDFTPFRDENFSFGFLVSFAAGVSLFCSAYLIPSFAISSLGMRAMDVGIMMLPSGAAFFASLVITLILVKLRRPPAITVPFGIACFILSMWWMAGLNGESGTPDMLPPLLLRSFGLGFLFLSITLFALTELARPIAAYGVALFYAARQAGGLFGLAFLETSLTNQTALNKNILATPLTSGNPLLSEHLGQLTMALTSRGMEMGTASRAALQMLGREVSIQATLIAFNSGFMMLMLFFFAATPFIVVGKISISKILNKTKI